MENIMILIEGVHTHADTETNQYAIENDNYGEGAPVYTWLLSPKVIEEKWLSGIINKEYALAETCYGLKIIKIKSFKIVKDTNLEDLTFQHGNELKYIIKLFDDKQINIDNPRINWDEIFGQEDK
ncbi:hypothetical protein EII25_03475 [Erysipelotrichaceae bacterium OH741_COT-311]|nr:hypothetical protein EII25_03475 [Erysipelotrichaceae bacterium OH741_COT-311]